MDLTHLTISKLDEKYYYSKVVLASVCHYCNSTELVVADVDVQGWKPEDYPSCVACGSCGVRGPWGKTEEDAVDKWNNWAAIDKAAIDDGIEWSRSPLSNPKENNEPF